MKQYAIEAHNLSKCYRLGLKEESCDTLAGACIDAIKSPFKNFKNLKNLTRFRLNSTQEDESILWALKDISFHIEAHKTFGIIGKNGAGKSTLLKILSRITYPTSGSATINGRVASLLEVGTGFHPELTGRENIFLNGTILGMTRKEIASKLDEIIAFAEVDKFIDTPIKRYSSGMGVRLAFAVAAHLDPEILIIDEVLAVGDIAFQKKCVEKMKNISQKAGRTILFVSHNMAIVRSLCDTSMLLHKGNIANIGDTESIVMEYASMASLDKTPTILLPSDPEAPAQGLFLHVENKSGERCTHFKLHEPWKVHYEIELSRDLEHVIASLGIVNMEAVPLITYWSEPTDLKKGRYRITYEIDLPINSGDISFAIGITSLERILYYKENIGSVSISEVSEGEQMIRAKGSGVFVGQKRPKIERL